MTESHLTARQSKQPSRPVAVLLAAACAMFTCLVGPVVNARAATPVGLACDEDQSTSVESCIYQYGYMLGGSFVLDHYGATFTRLDWQARMVSAKMTVAISNKVETHAISSITPGQEYTFKPSWSGQAIAVDNTGHHYQCGHAVLTWGHSTNHYNQSSGNVAKGNCSGFGDGGDRGITQVRTRVAPSETSAATQVLQIGQAVTSPDGTAGVVEQLTGPERTVVVGGKTLQATTSVVGVRKVGALVRPMASLGNCTNDGSFSVSLCVTQYFSRAGSYVAVDHYDLVAGRDDIQARLTSSLLRAGVLGQCKSGSCSGVVNDAEDFKKSAPTSYASNDYYPRWHSKYTWTGPGRYQCANAWLNWARSTNNYQIRMVPATCQGSV
jgi:hypothetical protein